MKAVEGAMSISEKLLRTVFPSFLVPEENLLRFHEADLREQMLLVSATDDSDGALNPHLIAGVLSQLNKNFDTKYAHVTSVSQICKLVKSAGKVGKLTNLFILGHGSPSPITVAEDAPAQAIFRNWIFPTNKRIYNQNFADCFNGLKPYAKIVLISCSTGGERWLFDNIAQRIADGSKRLVLAPPTEVPPKFLKMNENHDFSYAESYIDNLLDIRINFRAFAPLHQGCRKDFSNKKINELANQVVLNNFQDRGFINISIKITT